MSVREIPTDIPPSGANNRQSTSDGQFTTDVARIKLKHVYPKS